MQSIQHPLATQQYFLVECEREWAFQARFILGLTEQVSKIVELILEV